MEHYDPEKTARVWQRVQSGGSYMPAPTPRPTPIPEDRTLPELIAGELEDAADIQRLARRFTGPERAQLLLMARQERAHAAFLRTLLPRPRR